MAKIKTSKGEMDEATLKKQTGLKDDDVETTSHVEFWKGGNAACDHTFDPSDPTRMCTKKCGAELVHRSVTMKLKKAAAWAEPAVASFK